LQSLKPGDVFVMARHHSVNFYIILAILVLQLCLFRVFQRTSLLAATDNNTANSKTIFETDSLVQNICNQTNIDTLVHFVKILSGEDSMVIGDSTYLILCRNPLHPHNDLAVDFIFQTLTRFGLPAYKQVYSQSGSNVYAVKTGNVYPDQKFVVCAHYDNSPQQPPAPGADDNASGTAAVLETARILSQRETPYTVIFAHFDEEEIGHFGSVYFAQQAYQSGEEILGVVNLEMFGWDSNNDGLFDIHTRPIANSVALANLVRDLAFHYNTRLAPMIYNPGTPESDHASFWNYGYSALVFSQAYFGGDFNPHYQTSTDRLEFFNLEYFHALSKLAVATMAHLAFNGLNTTGISPDIQWVSDYSLRQNYPNPFNTETVIGYTLPVTCHIEIIIYNILGQKVATLVSEEQPAGQYRVAFNGQTLPSGIYYYKLTAGAFQQIRKMVLIR
jgi:hypothetical protein